MLHPGYSREAVHSRGACLEETVSSEVRVSVRTSVQERTQGYLQEVNHMPESLAILVLRRMSGFVSLSRVWMTTGSPFWTLNVGPGNVPLGTTGLQTCEQFGQRESGIIHLLAGETIWGQLCVYDVKVENHLCPKSSSGK